MTGMTNPYTVANPSFVLGCDECWGAQAPCDEHMEDFLPV